MKLVFVHLGNSVSRALGANLERFHRSSNHPGIHVIFDEQSFKLHSHLRTCDSFIYRRPNGVSEIFTTLTAPYNFRDGFWTYTVERFLALSQWHNAHPLDRLIHIESDILTLPTFPWSFFEGLDSLAWCGFSKSADVGAIFYSPSANQTAWFVDELLKFISNDPNLTDMTALSLIAEQFPSRIIKLPTNFHDDLASVVGLFDGAPHGMWLSGQDPRNHYGLVKRRVIIPESFVRPDRCEYKFVKSHELWVTEMGNAMPLHNLHIHSKRISLLGPFWKAALRREIWRERNNFFIVTFSISSFLNSVKLYGKRHKFFSRHTLRRLLRGIP